MIARHLFAVRDRVQVQLGPQYESAVAHYIAHILAFAEAFDELPTESLPRLVAQLRVDGASQEQLDLVIAAAVEAEELEPEVVS